MKKGRDLTALCQAGLSSQLPLAIHTSETNANGSNKLILLVDRNLLPCR